MTLFFAEQTILSSLAYGFPFCCPSLCFSHISHLSTYIFTQAYLSGKPVHVLLQPHFIFIPSPCRQHLHVGTAAPTLTPNLLCYTQLLPSATSKKPACSSATLCCHKNLCSFTPNHVRELEQVRA